MCLALNQSWKYPVQLCKLDPKPTTKKIGSFLVSMATHLRGLIEGAMYNSIQRGSDPKRSTILQVLFFKSPSILWVLKKMEVLTPKCWPESNGSTPPKSSIPAIISVGLRISPLLPSRKLLLHGSSCSVSHQLWLLGGLEGAERLRLEQIFSGGQSFN